MNYKEISNNQIEKEENAIRDCAFLKGRIAAVGAYVYSEASEYIKASTICKMLGIPYKYPVDADEAEVKEDKSWQI